MKIKIDNFILAQCPAATSSFDVYKKIKVKSGEKKGSEYESIVAYGVSLDRAVDVITSEKLFEKTETVSIKKYVDEYKKQREIFQKQLV